MVIHTSDEFMKHPANVPLMEEFFLGLKPHLKGVEQIGYSFIPRNSDLPPEEQDLDLDLAEHHNYTIILRGYKDEVEITDISNMDELSNCFKDVIDKIAS